MAVKRKMLTEADFQKIISIRPSTFTLDMIRELFAYVEGRDAQYDPEDEFIVPKQYREAASAPQDYTPAEKDWAAFYAPNWSTVEKTTIGRLIVNTIPFARSKKLRSNIPYFNKPFDKGVIGDIEQLLVDLRVADKIDFEDWAYATDVLQRLGYGCTTFVCPSMTDRTIQIPPKTKALKKKLIAENKAALAKGDVIVTGQIEKQLIASAKEELEDDPGMIIFDSGARGSLSNNFKNTALMRGAIKRSDDPSKIVISTASLEDGIPAEEFPYYADMMVQASGSRAIGTRDGGYKAKILNNSMQFLHLNKDRNSDCGTKHVFKNTITKDHLYRNILVGGKKVMITTDNLKEYVGTQQALFSPLYCGGTEGICAKCAGDMYYRIGILNIGLITNRIGTVLLNASLKAFHDTSLKLSRIDMSKYIF